MPSRHRVTPAALLAILLLVHPLPVSATESRMDVRVPVTDTLAGDTATAAAPAGPGTLGIAVASCRVGAELASQNPWHLGGVGFALCMVGIYMELDDFMHAPTR